MTYSIYLPTKYGHAKKLFLHMSNLYQIPENLPKIDSVSPPRSPLLKRNSTHAKVNYHFRPLPIYNLILNFY